MPQVTDTPIRITRHRSELGRWERVWQRPSRPLRELIDGYTGYRQRLADPAPHRGIPTATLPLVLSFGPAQTMSWPAAGMRTVTVSSFLAGVHDRYVIIEAEEHQGIQIDLRPVAAFRLLRQPLSQLTDDVVCLDELLGPDAERLVDDLASAPDWQRRFQRLDRFLIDQLVDAPGPAPEVEQAWARIVASAGRVRVGDLATETGWSTRHLRQRVREQLGLSPKRLARLTRFEHASRLLADPHRRLDLAEVALVAGYYDQAHLTNDVRHYSGLSPSQLLARRLPDEGGVFDLDAAGPMRRDRRP